MRDVAETVRAGVRTSIGSVPLYPYRRINPSEYHVQLYAGTEVPGRAALDAERDGTLYVHIFAKREEDIDSVYSALAWLDGHMADGTGHVYALSYRLGSATLLEEDDGTLHLAVIYTVRYYRREVA